MHKMIFLHVKPITILISIFIGITSVTLLTLGIQVFSQSEGNMNTENVQQKDLEQNDAEIQELLSILESCDENLPSATKISAIEKLGDLKAKKAIPSLIKCLDYEDKDIVSKTKPETINGVTVITEQNDLPLSRHYPATAALFKIGKPALSELVKVIEDEKPESLKSRNALYTIQQIFVADLSEGIKYLEDAINVSPTLEGKQRLLFAIEKIRKESRN